MNNTLKTHTKENLLEHYSNVLNSERIRTMTGAIWRRIWSGIQWQVYDIERENSVLKLFFDTPENLVMARQEACKQEDFIECLWHAYSIGKLRNVKIPAVFEKVTDDNGVMIWVIMEKVYGESLYEIESKKWLIQEWLESKESIHLMTEADIVQKYDSQLNWLDYFPEDFSEEKYGASLKKTIQELIDFFASLGLSHGDIHSGNLMIWKDWLLYLIDFGKALRSGLKAEKFRQAQIWWREFRQNISLWENKSSLSQVTDQWLKLPSVIPRFSEFNSFAIRREIIKIHHLGLPRWVMSTAMTVHYNVHNNIHPRRDTYYYPNIVAYNIDGWYFILSEDIRPDEKENIFSKKVLDAILESRIVWQVIGKWWKKSLIYSINTNVASLIQDEATIATDRILEQKKSPLS